MKNTVTLRWDRSQWKNTFQINLQVTDSKDNLKLKDAES